MDSPYTRIGTASYLAPDIGPVGKDSGAGIVADMAPDTGADSETSASDALVFPANDSCRMDRDRRVPQRSDATVVYPEAFFG